MTTILKLVAIILGVVLVVVTLAHLPGFEAIARHVHGR